MSTTLTGPAAGPLLTRLINEGYGTGAWHGPDLKAALADVTLGEPANGIREVAGPEAAPLADFVSRWLRKQGDQAAPE